MKKIIFKNTSVHRGVIAIVLTHFLIMNNSMLVSDNSVMILS